MLTLKVVTLDAEGQKETHLFYGERIIHQERDHVDHSLKAYSEVVIGGLIETTSNQQFNTSCVQIFGTDTVVKQDVFIFPCADCYIMHEGKTIDTFSARFK